MNDLAIPDIHLMRTLLRRIDALEAEVRQLARQRFPMQHNSRHDPVFCVLNAALAHNGTAEVERLIRKTDDTGWQRSGEKFDATDIWLNTGDSVETKTLCTIIPYEGKEVFESIYCQPSDWLPDP